MLYNALLVQVPRTSRLISSPQTDITLRSGSPYSDASQRMLVAASPDTRWTRSGSYSARNAT